MVKKLIIAVIVVCVAGVFFLPEITAFMAKSAFDEKNVKKPWAPGMAYRAANINMKMYRFGVALNFFQRCVDTWPEEEWVPKVHYKIALCYENQRKSREAIDAYQHFVDTYPNHAWVGQAKRRMTNIEANMD